MSSPGNTDEGGRRRGRRSVRLRLADGDVRWEARRGLPAGGREACRSGPRPCPYLWCKEHLWRLDGTDRPGHRHGGQPPPTVVRPASLATCALDAYQREHSFAEIGLKMGIGKRRAQQIAKAALAKLRADGLELFHLLGI